VSSAIAEALEQFKGQTADEIAAICKRRGIKGRTGTTYGCPLAIMLGNIGTGTYVIGRKYIVRRSGKVIEKAYTPQNLSTFIRKFDIGKYPELMAPAKRCMMTAKEKRQKDARTGNRHKPGYEKAKRSHIVKNHLTKLVDRFSQ
jgi:hypothetical protein